LVVTWDVQNLAIPLSLGKPGGYTGEEEKQNYNGQIKNSYGLTIALLGRPVASLEKLIRSS
jgi:hypothetical protein